jgi:truncated hemoglobin YjbI
MAQDFDLYQAIGGRETCTKLSTAFYARVAKDPLLRPLFPSSFKCAIEAFSAFLAQFLGGPSGDAQRRWWLSLRESHLRFKIGRKERDAWMSNMLRALDDIQIDEPVRSALRGLFERSSAYLVNRGQRPHAAEDRGQPPNDSFQQEMARRWEAQRVLDEAVAAVRDGDGDRAIALAESSTLQTSVKRDRSVIAGLLAVMDCSGYAAMQDYVRQRLLADPALTREHYGGGRTLLHGASGAGRLPTVELLLSLGADPNANDAGGHTSLYCLANECKIAGGASVVRALVRGGARVNAQDGVKHCTALHMAARRGNVEIAEALLDCGADIEARDSVGDTPLRRSVNCDKKEVAALLLSRGANLHSRGSQGLTPLMAARTSAMTRILRS